MEKEIMKNVELTVLNTNLFNDNNVEEKKITTLNLDNQDEACMLLNAMQNVDFKLNEEIGKKINCIGCYISERTYEEYSELSGELVKRKKHILMIFDDDNKSHVTASESCFRSFKDIISIIGLPSKEKPITLEPIKVDAKEKGHNFLKLKISK